MNLNESAAVGIAKEYQVKNNLSAVPYSAKIYKSFDVKGDIAWIVTGQYELFNEKMETFYIISDESKQVEYIMNEHGKINI